ncbi:MAG: hypothetical protein IMW94_10620 [Thermoanaerobacter sp.]|nr:hypothetical protein [Thermoanaerobacter sp.]
MRFSKLIVALVILFNAGFTGAVLWVFLKVGSEPSTLVTAWFAFTTGELMALAAIKRKEIGNSKEGEG